MWAVLLRVTSNQVPLTRTPTSDHWAAVSLQRTAVNFLRQGFYKEESHPQLRVGERSTVTLNSSLSGSLGWTSFFSFGGVICEDLFFR